MRRLLIIVIILAGLLVAADRAALATAQSQLAAEVQAKENLAEKPIINLHGFPFLTQAIGGHYDGGRLVIHDLRTEKLKVNRLQVDLRDVTLPLSDLISGTVSEVPVGAVTGVALVSYADLAAATGVPGLRIGPRGDKLELTFAVDSFGTSTPVVATARIGVANQAVRMTSVQIQGADLPEEVTRSVLGQVQESLEIGVLPYGLKVTDVRIAESGVEVSASARNTVLRKS